MRSPKQPEEDPETKARRLAAESRAETDREDSLQRRVTRRTDDVLRRFGQRAAMSGVGNFGGFGFSSALTGAVGSASSGGSAFVPTGGGGISGPPGFRSFR